MKKVISLMLALMLVFGASICVNAQEQYQFTNTGAVIEFSAEIENMKDGTVTVKKLPTMSSNYGVTYYNSDESQFIGTEGMGYYGTADVAEGTVLDVKSEKITFVIFETSGSPYIRGVYVYTCPSKVIYNVNGGNVAFSTDGNPGNYYEYLLDDDLISDGKPVRAGYKFEGWYSERTGGEKILTGADAKAAGGTIYAQWSEDLTGNNIFETASNYIQKAISNCPFHQWAKNADASVRAFNEPIVAFLFGSFAIKFI